jgi:hypothetical protein
MSTPRTGTAQQQRLRRLGLRVAPLPCMRDLDTAADADAIVADAPGSRTAHVHAELLAGAVR